VSRLDILPEDLGFAGAILANKDNQTTGGFLGQDYILVDAPTDPSEALAKLESLIADGSVFIGVMADADMLLTLADAAGDRALIFNLDNAEDALRNDSCRANILHLGPSFAMRADALTQYMVWKKWTDVALITGSHEEDELWSAALKNSIFTQPIKKADVIFVADETEVFGAYLPYHTWSAIPVAGSAGLTPTSWHPALEAWGATQFQRRFEREIGRLMRPEDYQAWMALRVLGEAVTRTNSADPETIRSYILSDDFELAGFKGEKLTFRPWNGQLRQPVLLINDKLIVSVSPQEGFLHQTSLLDTLGNDQAESACQSFN